MISWALLEQSIAHPGARQAMTFSWSPKMERACVAMARAAMWNTVDVELPGDFVHVGDHEKQSLGRGKGRRERARGGRPCTAPAAPASDCISTTEGMVPQIFFVPSADSSSATSPIVDEGVIG